VATATNGYYTRGVRALGAGKVLGVDLSQRITFIECVK